MIENNGIARLVTYEDGSKEYKKPHPYDEVEWKNFYRISSYTDSFLKRFNHKLNNLLISFKIKPETAYDFLRNWGKSISTWRPFNDYLAFLTETKRNELFTLLKKNQFSDNGKEKFLEDINRIMTEPNEFSDGVLSITLTKEEQQQDSLPAYAKSHKWLQHLLLSENNKMLEVGLKPENLGKHSTIEELRFKIDLSLAEQIHRVVMEFEEKYFIFKNKKMNN